MEKINNEGELVAKVLADAGLSGKQNVVIQAGHFPLFYNSEVAYAEVDAWGAFTPYSMRLGTKIGKELKCRGFDVKFAVIADDINYENILGNERFGYSARRDRRRSFYKCHSGTNAILPSPLQDILLELGFTLSDITRQDQGKPGRRDSLIISEKVLGVRSRKVETNRCAKSYFQFIEDLAIFNKSDSYLVSFIPDRCTSNVCDRVLESNPGIYASHMFMQTDSVFLSQAGVEEIWNGWGVFYRKN